MVLHFCIDFIWEIIKLHDILLLSRPPMTESMKSLPREFWETLCQMNIAVTMAT